MNTEDNIVDMTQEQYNSAMEELLTEVEQERLGRIIAGVLEFLTVRAIVDGPFYLMTDDEQAITVIAANKDATVLRNALPESFRSWDETVNDALDFVTDSDPGDEQDESTS